MVLGFTNCNIEIALKWSVLVAVIAYVSYAVIYFVTGQLPAAGVPEIAWIVRDIYSGVSVVPRLLDPLIALIPAFILFLPMFGHNRTAQIFRTDADGVGITYVLGLLAGIIGSGIVAATGIPVAFWLGVCWGVIMLFVHPCTNFEYELWQPFMSTVVAAVTGWCLLTLIVGSLAGLLYPAICLAAGAATFFGVILIGWLIKVSTPYFFRLMMTCRADRAKAQN